MRGDLSLRTTSPCSIVTPGVFPFFRSVKRLYMYLFRELSLFCFGFFHVKGLFLVVSFFLGFFPYLSDFAYVLSSFLITGFLFACSSSPLELDEILSSKPSSFSPFSLLFDPVREHSRCLSGPPPLGLFHRLGRTRLVRSAFFLVTPLFASLVCGRETKDPRAFFFPASACPLAPIWKPGSTFG